MKHFALKVTLLFVVALGITIILYQIYGQNDSLKTAPDAKSKQLLASEKKTKVKEDADANPLHRMVAKLTENALNVEDVLDKYNLDEHLWEKLRYMSNEQLDAYLSGIQEEFKRLQQASYEMIDLHNEFFEKGDEQTALEFIENEIFPIFEERDKLVGQAILVAMARKNLFEKQYPQVK